METWFAVVRSWNDQDVHDDHPAWRAFGAPDRRGVPMEFVGTAPDAMRQLEDEIPGVIEAAVRVSREERRLIVEMENEFGASEHVEYRLVRHGEGGQKHPVQRQRMGQQRAGEDEPLPESDTRRFLAEFKEVAGDVALDFGVSMLDLDEEVGARVNDFVIELLVLARDDNAEAIRNIMSSMLWMFMMGREHAVRGYASPVPRAQTDDGIVPDTVADMFGLDEE